MASEPAPGKADLTEFTRPPAVPYPLLWGWVVSRAPKIYTLGQLWRSASSAGAAAARPAVKRATAAVNFIVMSGRIEPWCESVIGVWMSGGDQLWLASLYIYYGKFNIVVKTRL
jgi:hypothetical protein